MLNPTQKNRYLFQKEMENLMKLGLPQSIAEIQAHRKYGDNEQADEILATIRDENKAIEEFIKSLPIADEPTNNENKNNDIQLVK